MKATWTDSLLGAFRSGTEEIELAEAQGVQRTGPTENGKAFVEMLRVMTDDAKTAVIIDLCGRLIVTEGELNELKLEMLT